MKVGLRESWWVGRFRWLVWRWWLVWWEEIFIGIDGGFVFVVFIFRIVFGEGIFVGLFFFINWRRIISIVS